MLECWSPMRKWWWHSWWLLVGLDQKVGLSLNGQTEEQETLYNQSQYFRQKQKVKRGVWVRESWRRAAAIRTETIVVGRIKAPYCKRQPWAKQGSGPRQHCFQPPTTKKN